MIYNDPRLMALNIIIDLFAKPAFLAD